jgi:ABC-2 type transport system permease protein
MKWGITVMKSKTSFINRGILRNDFKRYTWIGIVYLLGLLLTVPLQLVMIFSRPEEVKMYYDASVYLRALQLDYSPLSLILILIVPVLAGLLLFRYLQANIAADMTHALPIKRATLYNTHIVAGLTLLFVPLVITALITWAVVAGLGIDFVQGKDILSWLNVCLLMNLVLFLSTVVVGMFTGLSTLQGLLTYILLLVPAGLSVLVLHSLKMHVYGFPYDLYAAANLDKLSPLLRIPSSGSIPLSTGELIFYILLCIALYLIGRYLYQQRKVESAGNAITFTVLRPIFKYCVTFCTMLLLGSYFYSTQENIIWTYFGYLLGAGIGYFLTAILLEKSIAVFKWQQVKGLGVYTLVIIGLIGLLQVDIIGYEKRLPEMSQVENVYMDTHFHPLIYKAAMHNGTSVKPHLALFKDKDNIANIYNLHQEIIAHRGEEKGVIIPRAINQKRVSLAYQLKDGSCFYRNYTINFAKYKEQLKPIYESREHKIHQHELLRVNLDDIKLVEINSQNGNKSVSISDKEMLQQAVAVLRNDIYDQSYEDMTINKRPAWGDIMVTIAYDKNQPPAMPDVAMVADNSTIRTEKNYYQIYLSWEKSYMHFERWLQSTGLYNQARILPDEDISYALIDYVPDGIDRATYRNLREKGLNEELLEEKPGILKISDSAQLELCLQNYRDYSYSEQAVYLVVFKLKNGNSFSGLFPQAEAPDFLTEHFAQ